jgi:GNAT superfamily N-acetyltransferase
MENIVKLNECTIMACIFKTAFLDVAKELHGTKENAPNHLAYINSDGIAGWLNKWSKIYGLAYYEEHISFIERVTTLPEYRNLGVGKTRITCVETKRKHIGRRIVEIHVTDTNTVFPRMV